MYIHERFSKYKEAIGERFKGKLNWEVKNDFQKNAVKIWQNYTDYRQPGFYKSYRQWMINIVKATCQLVVIVTIVAAIFPLIFLPSHYKEQVGDSILWIIIPIILSGALWWLMIKVDRGDKWDLGEVNDLVQGSIEAPIGELEQAYRHFNDMDTISIVRIEENLDDLQRVRVNFEYD